MCPGIFERYHLFKVLRSFWCFSTFPAYRKFLISLAELSFIPQIIFDCPDVQDLRLLNCASEVQRVKVYRRILVYRWWTNCNEKYKIVLNCTFYSKGWLVLINSLFLFLGKTILTYEYITRNVQHEGLLLHLIERLCHVRRFSLFSSKTCI